ncbi:HEAVY METAL ASSOCIATED PROTEIN 21, SODIUM POTASSIUM ROOT DEFECTIVE 2 [Hibiscus trionum]|uniref:HEAVY METAL ASSOCIATED PROTEIN 21, SODIUM POTASSIUM ROOT DEFECTIVE 2 n=1 Tax=Hibiscus trionum TaxID=183268 RepID=A0A9W7LXG4_HIBTR|nr:HEAVY METAL ASSOCIATED PROTEIN 21, SODIUM POTASSIUM ROOT DEFECTIVE 2 [Hibiscus trionum]
MKKMDIFCASRASTAVCLSMDRVASSSCSSASAVQLGGRAIDRHNPIIQDAKRFTRNLPSNPCTSQPPPINPLPYHQLKKSSTKSSNDCKKKKSSLKPTDTKAEETKAIDFVTPPASSRYLLGDNNNNNNNGGFFDGLSDYDPVWALVPAETNKIQAVKQEQSIVSKPSPSSPSEKPSKDQVVVLRVSLHCKGCEGKVRKHLSRMKGVTSFSIDFPAKKVTIVGDVTPLGVQASVSKVKSAQFWTSAMVASSANLTKTSRESYH